MRAIRTDMQCQMLYASTSNDMQLVTLVSVQSPASAQSLQLAHFAPRSFQGRAAGSVRSAVFP